MTSQRLVCLLAALVLLQPVAASDFFDDFLTPPDASIVSDLEDDAAREAKTTNDTAPTACATYLWPLNALICVERTTTYSTATDSGDDDACLCT